MKNLFIYFYRKIWVLAFKIKFLRVNSVKRNDVKWEVKFMTDEEIRVGKQLRDKLLKIYHDHPEYRKYKIGMDRYEVFLEKMSEKYNVSTIKVRQELQNSRGY